jgi:phage/plasmid-associated DNA primase
MKVTQEQINQLVLEMSPSGNPLTPNQEDILLRRIKALETTEKLPASPNGYQPGDETHDREPQQERKPDWRGWSNDKKQEVALAKTKTAELKDDETAFSANLKEEVEQDKEQPERTDAELVLNEHATETQLARLLESKLPPIRCVGDDWFVYQQGVWRRTSSNEFKSLALSIQDLRSRTARKASDVLRHVEYANQATDGKEFRSFHFQDANGELLINCANCVLAVSAAAVRQLPHSEDYLFTGQLEASYDPTASSPVFDDAVQFSLPDPADIETLRYFAGYILLPDCRHQVALCCYGPAETGKSTVSTGIEAALGQDLVTVVSLSQLSNPENKNLAKLASAALNLSTELDAIEVGGEQFKLLVSGEALEADRKYRDSISLRATCKLWFNANHLPRFRKGTDAELRRLRFIRFDRKVSQPDETLQDKIKR